MVSKTISLSLEMIKMAEYRVGAVARLNSGGPKMTIQSFRAPHEDYFCKWLAGKKMKSGYFDEATLKKVKEEEDQQQSLTTHFDVANWMVQQFEKKGSL